MRLIIDGPDGGGKSTLAKRIAEQSGFEIIHFSYPKTEEEKANMFKMYTDAIYKHDNVIFDRSWYSEMVYGRILRGKSAISFGQMGELERITAANGGGLIIHCTDTLNNIWDRFKARGDDFIPPNIVLLNSIINDYDQLFHTLPHVLPVVRYNVNKNVY